MAGKQMSLAGKCIGAGNAILIIAEVGINHNGDMRQARALLQAAKEAGADAVKLQSYITENRVPADSPIFDILKDCELTFDQQSELFELGRDLGILIFSTPFDAESVDFLESVFCPAYKVASFDTVNKALLRKIAGTRKPVIMSTGMTNLNELKLALTELEISDDEVASEVALLHCVSSYPTPAEEANLALISLLKTLHSGPVGYSDHTIGTEVPLMAVAAGAEIIEKHFTLDSKAEGPDHALSADPITLEKMVVGIRRMERILGPSELRIREVEMDIVPFRRVTE